MSYIMPILIFSVLIIIHELGHFLAARRAGVKVEKFAIGFGPAIFKRMVRETEFLICIFPIGGYVKMAGDSRAESKGKKNEFFAKSAAARIGIVFAGPLANYLLAFIILWFFAFLGFPSSQPVIGEALAGFPAEAAGLLPGDRIVEVSGSKVISWNQMAEVIHKAEKRVNLKIERGGKVFHITAPLRQEEFTNELGRAEKMSVIGISPELIRYNPFRSFFEGGKTLVLQTANFLRVFYAIITGAVPFKKAAMGPLGIYFLSSAVAKAGILAVLNLISLLSLSLAIINLFPIPVLDGGHILFFLIEKIRGKEISQKTENFLVNAGVVALSIIFIFVLYNDIKRGADIFGEKEVRSKEVEK